ncbi:PEP-CTERM sorting domain-containing protein [Tunturiibacter empetritectus]|uniref:Ice-binding protein C-terminal domain-containing protein n=1 Tax=Tunturiibacter lichenicola TaxID=2051959 RepID=A0A852VH41_9BACT|nr:PEP-CTERM sorting domain-containing protein [Edaphobacter lichenicola]NYF88852.1 hypothetical protein [Edaphobacter lichenicola]
MRLRTVGLCILALAVACASAAHADTFSFNFTGSAFNGSGTITASASGSGVYTITNISGTVDNQAISKLLSVNAFDNNDNLLYSPGFLFGAYNFDTQGVSFQLGSGGDRVNIGQGGFLNLFEVADLDPSKSSWDVTEYINIDVEKIASTSPVPEPGTLALLGTGILGVAGLMRRRLTA